MRTNRINKTGDETNKVRMRGCELQESGKKARIARAKILRHDSRISSVACETSPQNCSKPMYLRMITGATLGTGIQAGRKAEIKET